MLWKKFAMLLELFPRIKGYLKEGLWEDRLIRRLDGREQHRMILLLLQYRYWNYNADKPFLAQYRSNHVKLLQKLRDLCNEE